MLLRASVITVLIVSTSATVASAEPAAKGEREASEVIRIRGKHPRPPRPKNFSATKAPPYSDRAITRNAWTRAWLLLDIDASGKVQRFKFIKRPGYDLERIAASEAFKLRFEPARNEAGRAVRSSVMWPIEWPAYWWLIEFMGTATRLPPIVHHGRGPDSLGAPRSMADSVPCAGSGPMELGSIRPGYRDCSQPDLSRDFDDEPWVTRVTRR